MCRKKYKNMWRCDSLGLRQFLLEILKSNQPLIHINLFVFERASCGYLARLNRSLVEEVMAVIRTLRSPETSTRPGELLPCKFTWPGTTNLRWKSPKGVENLHAAGWIYSVLIHAAGCTVLANYLFCRKHDFWERKKKKKARVKHHSTWPPPTLTHTSKNTLRERIEDWRL